MNKVIIGVLAVVITACLLVVSRLDPASRHDFWVNMLAGVAGSAAAALILALVWRRVTDWITTNRWRATHDAMHRAICARLGAAAGVVHDLYCATPSELAGYGSSPWQEPQRGDQIMDWVHSARRLRGTRDEIDAMTYGPMTRTHGKFGTSGPTELSVLAPPRPGWDSERWLRALAGVERASLPRATRAASLMAPHLDHLRLVLLPRLVDLTDDHARPALVGRLDTLDVAFAQWQRAAKLVATIDEVESADDTRQAAAVRTARRWLDGETPPSPVAAWYAIDHASRTVAGEIDAAMGLFAALGALYLPLAVEHAEEPEIARKLVRLWNSEMIHARRLDAMWDLTPPTLGRAHRVFFRVWGGWHKLAKEEIAKQEERPASLKQTERPGDLTFAEMLDSLDEDAQRRVQEETDRRAR